MITSVIGNLPQGRTRTNERYAYIGVSDWDWDGKLVITAGIKKGVTDEYHVLEVEPNGFPGRSFLLAKQNGKGEVYQCSVGTDPDPYQADWKCTCRAGQVGRHKCKHFLSLHDRLKQEAASKEVPNVHSDDRVPHCR
jgi:hypothetical protein